MSRMSELETHSQPVVAPRAAKILVYSDDRDVRGYWELRGYSNTAHPWRNDRYS